MGDNLKRAREGPGSVLETGRGKAVGSLLILSNTPVILDLCLQHQMQPKTTAIELISKFKNGLGTTWLIQLTGGGLETSHQNTLYLLSRT